VVFIIDTFIFTNVLSVPTKFLIVNQKYTFVLKRICLFDKAATSNDSKNMKSREKI